MKQKGMTLLEILIALSIFTVSSIYITQTIRHMLTKKREIDTELKIKRIQYNILDVLIQDLKGVTLSFDLNAHLNQYFPLKKDSSINLQRGFNRIDPQFHFSGKEEQLTFTSYSPYIENKLQSGLVKIDYTLSTCKGAPCLIRGVTPYWSNKEDTDYRKPLIIISELQSLKWSYYHPEKKEWLKEWEFLNFWQEGKEDQVKSKHLLPSSVRMHITWNTGKSAFYNFSLSHPFFRIYTPSTLSPLVFINFSDLTPSSSPDKNLKENAPSKESDTPLPLGHPLVPKKGKNPHE